VTAASLDGVTVVDFSAGIAGPMATGQLADHGATVIRVEPLTGDPYAPFVSGSAYNRGKLSFAADLRDEASRREVVALIDKADVVVQSWKPGRAAAWQLDPATLRARHRELICCTISGYGLDSGDRDRAGYDALVSARIGARAHATDACAPPVYLAVPVASIGAALLAVIGVAAALFEREDTGEGCEVETSLVDGALAFLNMFWEDLGDAFASGLGGDGLDPRRYRLLVRSFQCADGEFLGIHTGAGGSHARLIEAIGLAHQVRPVAGSREKQFPLTPEEADIVESEVPRIFASRERAHWLQVLREADVTAIPVLRQTEAFDTEQTSHLGVVVEVDDHDDGPLQQVGIPAQLGRSPGRVRGPAPRTGEHTDAVRAALRVSPTKADFAARLAAVEKPC
jgi:crotonobetainyl-CoA:carnitine CoA-transferase CaiB-like acyl-CoA transferase